MELQKLKIQNDILLINPTEIIREEFSIFKKAKDINLDTAIICYIHYQRDVEIVLKELKKFIATEDQLIWLIYPKSQSPLFKEKLDVNRNTFLNFGEEFNIRPVSQVSIDSSFSALRFRNKKYVNVRR